MTFKEFSQFHYMYSQWQMKDLPHEGLTAFYEVSFFFFTGYSTIPVLRLIMYVTAILYDMDTTVLWLLGVIAVTFQLLWLEV